MWEPEEPDDESDVVFMAVVIGAILVTALATMLVLGGMA